MQRNPVKRLQKFPRNTNPPLNWTLGTFCMLYTAYESNKETNSKAHRKSHNSLYTNRTDFPNPKSTGPTHPLTPLNNLKNGAKPRLRCQLSPDPLFSLAFWSIGIVRLAKSISAVWIVELSFDLGSSFVCNVIYFSSLLHTNPKSERGRVNGLFRIVRTGPQHTITSHSHSTTAITVNNPILKVIIGLKVTRLASVITYHPLTKFRRQTLVMVP